jgi:hypothetical protein
VAWSLESRFTVAGNAEVLAFIASRQPSAHDDGASALIESSKGLPGVGWYCPDPHRYAYVVLHTRENRIFAIAFGMSSLAYRLPQERVAAAVADGGRLCPEIGANWIAFPPWEGNEPGARLKRWCGIAYDAVRER